jgi:hypothetical protein
MTKEGAREDEEANTTANDMQIRGLSKMRTSCTGELVFRRETIVYS